MSNLNESFFGICIESFRFLIERFGFSRGAKRVTGGVYTVTYRNSTTAVLVGLEWQEQYVFVELCRLVDGKIKDNPVVIRPESQLTVFNLEDVLEIRNPELKLSAKHFARRLTVDAVRKTLSHYARVIEESASDILRGDFTLFDKLEHLVKQRAKEAANAEHNRQPYAVATEIAGERQRPAEVREPVGK